MPKQLTEICRNALSPFGGTVWLGEHQVVVIVNFTRQSSKPLLLVLKDQMPFKIGLCE